MESKEEKFVRLAESRTNDAIKKIRLIGNLANKRNYEYDKDEVNEIFKVLESELKNAKQLFKLEMEKEKSFKLNKKG
ncbi:hypothetical protein [Mammaliicoccus sciuri]|uniref:hypothetical protein n=2 Tax=Mammaliicoccus sciuri TaxID=1296 RepID=UPI001330B5B0|nr:hypothetical protein [Mammaliicoccus sciuri]MEB6254134.1 hypothetical protein [Mammaliicoccus sciuri]MEB6256949.1 hypothetical protein [Mammaliicoccus sciuri]MEB6294566.1 hypothetical protein [Mammaliicoccus sciuri]MEB8191508.1 hypothetical protein [Mammaliicoccus sciuri]WQK71771.1 hypothetical protein P3T85_02185 [Mammaliicoccus sciuri]